MNNLQLQNPTEGGRVRITVTSLEDLEKSPHKQTSSVYEIFVRKS